MRDEARLLAMLERDWEESKMHRIWQEDSYWRGAFEVPDPAYPGMYAQIEAGLPMTIPLYSHPGSKWYRSSALLTTIEEQIDYLLRTQFPSGCVSLINCNIDSPPDTGFTVRIAALSYHALASIDEPKAQAASGKLKEFLYRTIPCLLTGGIHTPNHRWVLCGALALLYEIFPDERLRERADAWLAEGLDINESGEWTERSNAIYNAICCNFLYHAAQVFGYDDLMEPIRSNLDMMKFMLHPGGSIATEYSSRQDRGKEIRMGEEYYIAFTLMAGHAGDGQFRTMADEALDYANNPGLPLLYRMKFPIGMDEAGERSMLPTSYEAMLNEGRQAPVSGSLPLVRTAFHSGSPLVRFRSGDLSVTVASGQPEFLYVQFGKARMHGLRWSVGWFGIAGAPMQQLVKHGPGRYELKIELEGSYRGPLEGADIGRTGRSEFDFSVKGRQETHISRLTLRVAIELQKDGVALKLRTEGMPHIFAQAVLSFDSDGTLEGDGLRRLSDRLYHQTGDRLTYRRGGDIIEVTCGGDGHRYAALRNDRMDADHLNVICNYVTPMEAALHFRCRKEGKGETER
jgi:hypothetical protein